MCNYIYLKKLQILFEIKSIAVYNWLYKLGFKYKNIKKDVFINKYKLLNAAENDKKV